MSNFTTSPPTNIPFVVAMFIYLSSNGWKTVKKKVLRCQKKFQPQFCKIFFKTVSRKRENFFFKKNQYNKKKFKTIQCPSFSSTSFFYYLTTEVRTRGMTQIRTATYRSWSPSGEKMCFNFWKKVEKKVASIVFRRRTNVRSCCLRAQNLSMVSQFSDRFFFLHSNGKKFCVDDFPPNQRDRIDDKCSTKCY